MREIVSVVCAAILSFVLLATSVVAVLHFTHAGQLDRDPSVLNQSYATVRAKYGDPWQLMSQTARLYEYGVVPSIALIAGGFVGLFATRRQVLLGCVAVLPLAFFVLAALSFSVRGFLVSAAYLILASVGAGVLRLLKSRRSAVPDAR